MATGVVEVKPAARQVTTGRQTKLVVPSEMAGLGVMTRPDPPPFERTRLLLMSRPKGGKTTLLGGMPDTCILDFRGGAHSIMRQRAHYIPIKSYDHYRQVIDTLIDLKQNGKSPYKRIALDVGGEWVELIGGFVVSEYNETASEPAATIGEVGQKGAGWGRQRQIAVGDLGDIYRAGYGWVVTVHMSERVINEQIVLQAVMPPGIMDVLYQEPELLGVLSKTELEVPIYQEKTINLPGGKTRTTKVETGEMQRTVKYRLDMRSVNEAKYGGSRVQMDEVLEIPNVKDGYGCDVLAQAYEARRREMLAEDLG